MTVISGIQTYIKNYSGLASGAPVWVNFILNKPEYSIVPLPGAHIVSTDINGNTLREFPFAFQLKESTADDPQRLANIGFFESFSDWLDAQTEAEDFPSIGAGKTPEKIEALDHGYLFQQGESGTGIYQVQAKLTYEQAA